MPLPGGMSREEFLSLDEQSQKKLHSAWRFSQAQVQRQSAVGSLEDNTPAPPPPAKFGEAGFNATELMGRIGERAASFVTKGPFGDVGQKAAEFIQPTGADAGGTVGGIVGAARGATLGGSVAGPPGAIVGGIIGGGLGAFAGGTAGEAADQAFSDNPFDTPKMIKEGIRQAAVDMFGGTVMGVLKGTVKLAAGRPIVGAISANERLAKLTADIEPQIAKVRAMTPDQIAQLPTKAAQERAMRIQQIPDETLAGMSESWGTMGELMQSRLIRSAEESVGASRFARQLPAKKAAQEDLADMLVENMRANLGPLYDTDTLGKKLAEAWDSAGKKITDDAGPLYDDIGKRLETIDVQDIHQIPGKPDLFGLGTPAKQTTTTRKIVKGTNSDAGMVDIDGFSSPFESLNRATKELKSVGVEVKRARGLEDNLIGIRGERKISWNAAKKLRTSVGELAEALADKPGHADEVRRLGDVYKKLTKQMERGIQAYDKANPGEPAISPMWKQADAWYKDFNRVYKHAEMRGWMRMVNDNLQGPSAVRSLLEPQNTSRLKHVVEGLAGTEDLNMLRNWHMTSLEQQARMGGRFNPQKYLELMGDSVSGFGREAMETLHGKETVQAMETLASDLKVFSGGVEGAGGKFAMMMVETGPMFQVLAGGALGTAAGGPLVGLVAAGATLTKIGITVEAMNRLLANPKYATALATMATTSPKSAAGIAATARVLGAIGREDINSGRQESRSIKDIYEQATKQRELRETP